MRKRVLGATFLLAVLAVLSVVAASSGGVFGPSTRGVTPLPSSSCSGIVGPKNAKLLISSDLPLQGATRPQTIQMTKVIGFILKQHGFKAGKYTVAYQSCDDSTAALAKWDPAKCTANAQAYVGDKSVVGIIGTFNSGCAKLEIPIANRASPGPLAMVSPANTWPGLTHVGPVLNPGEPGIYYPTGKRNYARVVATDDFQAPADAIVTKQIGLKSVYILTDNETYGKGVAELYQKAAGKLGLDVKGFEAWDPKATSYTALGDKIKATGAQAVFFGGIICNNGTKLLKDIRDSVGPTVRFVGPDGWTPFSAVAAAGTAASEGMLISVAGPPLSKLGPKGKAFVKAWTKATHQALTPYAAYAAQAADVILDAIARSNGTRAAITANLFKTKVKGGILGTFNIDKNGDTTLKGITIYKMTNGDGKTFKTIFPPASLVK